MKTSSKIAAQLFKQEQQISKIARTTQTAYSTVGGEKAVPVAETVVEAAVTNEALPAVQDDAAASNDGVSDLQDALAAMDDDLDARFDEGRAELEDARADIAGSMQDIEDAFGQTVDGLSENVETAIRAAGDAKTEAEAASDAALAAAGLAASKGKTIVQVTPPSGANADPANLWIDISTDSNGVPKNQPNRYNPDTAKWEPVSDAQAVAAAQSAATAVAAAQAAKDVADQANAAAGVAKTTADNANTAALQAAGIANGKGKVIYQASKPSGTNAAAGNLWIRTSDNTPWAYDATIPDWVQVTDQTAKDAASAAVAAQQAATAAANAASAAQATADSKPLILFSSTAGPSGTAPTGSTWFLWDSAKNIAGQWLQSGTLANPVWTPQQIRSEVIANLDLGKLTAGSAAVADLVAQKIAASTANFQTVNVSNLFVTTGATLSQAVIDYLFANVVQAKKITAGMIDVDSLNGITLTGATLQTAPSGERVVITAPGGAQGYTNAVNWFTSAEMAGSVRGFGSLTDGSRYPGLSIVSGQDADGRLGALDVAMQPRYDANYAAGNAVNSPKVGVVTTRSLHAQGHLQASGYLASASGLMLRWATDNDWTKNWYPVIKPGVAGAFVVDTNGGLVTTNTIAASGAVTAGDFKTNDGKSIQRPAVARGVSAATTAAIAQSSYGPTISIKFPTGMFANPPVVTANSSHSRVMCAVSNVTKDGCDLNTANWSPASAPAGIVVNWIAESTD